MSEAAPKKYRPNLTDIDFEAMDITEEEYLADQGITKEEYEIQQKIKQQKQIDFNNRRLELSKKVKPIVVEFLNETILPFLANPTLEYTDGKIFANVWDCYSDGLSYKIFNFLYTDGDTNPEKSSTTGWGKIPNLDNEVIVCRKYFAIFLEELYSNPVCLRKLCDSFINKTSLEFGIDKSYLFLQIGEEIHNHFLNVKLPPIDTSLDKNTQDSIKAFYTIKPICDMFIKFYDLSFTYRDPDPEKNYLYTTKEGDIFYRGVSQKPLSSIPESEYQKTYLSTSQDKGVACLHTYVVSVNKNAQRAIADDGTPSQYIMVLHVEPGITLIDMNKGGLTSQKNRWQKEFVFPRGLTITTPNKETTTEKIIAERREYNALFINRYVTKTGASSKGGKYRRHRKTTHINRKKYSKKRKNSSRKKRKNSRKNKRRS
jgi:hypothetical protein